MNILFLSKIKIGKLKLILNSGSFLILSCFVILAINLLYKSYNDIGSDTAIYIDIGKKIALGGRYYYDYFESNLPFNFYIYALQYKIHQLTGISRIFLADFFVYFLFFLSLIFSLKILKKTTLSENKIASNFFIISYFVGFFLRTPGLEINEFGTKTTFLLLLLFPYLIYSIEFKQPLTKKDLVYRGIIMASIPCFKPHYIIFLIIVEGYRFLKKPSFNFFIQLDILITALLGLIALNWVIYFEREYFEFMVPMWRVIYPTFNKDINHFLYLYIALFNQSFLAIGLFVVFFKMKKINNDLLVCYLFYLASFFLLFTETIYSFDQNSISFYCMLFLVAYVFTNKICLEIIDFKNNYILFCCLFILALINNEMLHNAIFGNYSIICLLWFIGPILLWWCYFKKLLPSSYIIYGLIAYFILLLLLTKLILSYKFLLIFQINILMGLFFCFFCERLANHKNTPVLSNPSLILLYASVVLFIFSIFKNYHKVIVNNQSNTHTSKYKNFLNYYIKKYQLEKNEQILFFFDSAKNSLYLYLNKDNEIKSATHSFLNYRLLDFPTKIPAKIFNENDQELYHVDQFFDEQITKSLNDKKYKFLIIMNNFDLDTNTYCSISKSEYLFRIKKYKNLILITKSLILQSALIQIWIWSTNTRFT